MTEFKLGSIHEEHGHLSTQAAFRLPAKTLTTHGIILGQTGSGKTGLGISLLEECAIAGIPVIAVDPKGDLGNLLLQFPAFRARDFAPWAEDPVAEAKAWKDGVGDQVERMHKLLETTNLKVWTPGSTKGFPIALVGDLHPPAVRGEDRWRLVLAETSGILELAGINADPTSSPEALLISTIIEWAWAKGNSLELVELVQLVMKPPFKKVGALSVEQACPKNKRKSLAQKLNALISSPGMRSWTSGDDLEVEALLHTRMGQPRVSVLSIAHLGDEERMFFLTKLLSEVIAWMRQQPGSKELKALLYIDEVFGYLPPVKNPPSKLPLLLLLKQARAFGLGVVLASQNPIDVDYRALSNLGTWMLGRLQTERDINRVVDGLRAAAAEQGEDLDVAELRATMAGLPKRTFLVRSPDTPGCRLVKTRHTLSYLRGPLTLDEIDYLCKRPLIDLAACDRDLEHVTKVGKEIDAVMDSIEQAQREVDEELEVTTDELIVRAAAGPAEALSQCRTIPPGAVERARGRVHRLTMNIRRANQLIDEGKYEEARNVWEENPVFQPETPPPPPEPEPQPPAKVEPEVKAVAHPRMTRLFEWIVVASFSTLLTLVALKFLLLNG